jgi:hypothetical protein
MNKGEAGRSDHDCWCSRRGALLDGRRGDQVRVAHRLAGRTLRSVRRDAGDLAPNSRRRPSPSMILVGVFYARR